MSGDDRGLAARVHRQALVVSLLLTAGVAVFGIVAATLVVTDAFEPPLTPGTAIRLGVLAVGALLLGIARATEASKGPQRRGATREEVAGRWFTGVLVSQALREAVGLAGVLLVFLAGDLPGGGALVGVALFLMLARTPRSAELDERLRRVGD